MRRMIDARRTALLVVAAALTVLGLCAVYVRVELAEPEAFADRGVSALQSGPVRKVIAETVAVELLERASPDLVATRPLVLTAIEAVLETESFERVLRRAAITAHGVLLDGDDDVAVELGELREVLGPALESAAPGLAARVPSDLRPEIAEIRRGDVASRTIRVAERTSAAAWPLLLLGLAGLVGLVLTAADRRRAVAAAGIAATVAGGSAILVLVALETQVVSHTEAVGVVSRDAARDAARATWQAMAADLQRAFLVLATVGLALWLSALLVELRVDRRAAVERLGGMLAGGGLRRRTRVARGFGVAAFGALALLRVGPLFELLAAGVAGALVLLGLTEVIGMLRGVRAARGSETPDTGARGPRSRRRVLLVATGGVAVLAGGTLALVILLGARGTPAPLADDQLRACNGLAELCDRRLDQVVLAATHNSMSAADRPGWLFANQTLPIPRQLDDGIRLLMLDPHYGIVNREGRIRTDLAAEGTTRNRVAAQLGNDAVGAAERLAGRLGLVPDRGSRKVYLCHSLCELGAEGFGSALRDIRFFLERNRAEVLVLLLESSVAPEEVEKAVREADLEPYLATLTRGRPLPTLRTMITSGRRLVVLDERDGGPSPWHHPAFVFAQNTDIDAFTERRDSCVPARGTPDSPLLIANHWVDRFPPPASAAKEANRAGVLRRRVAGCEQRLGRRPNAIAVDFYERGDLLDVVEELNRRAPRQPAASRPVGEDPRP